MKQALLLVLLGLAGCGSSDGDDDDGGDSGILNGTNLAALPMLANACAGTVIADFNTTDETFGMINASFSAGDKLVFGFLTSGTAAHVFGADAGLTGVDEFDVPADKLSFDCTGSLRGIAVLSDVELFSDKARSTSVCTLKAEQTFLNASLKGFGSVLASSGSYDATVTLPVLTGTTCPADTELHFYLPALTHKYGSTSKTGAFMPMFGVNFLN